MLPIDNGHRSRILLIAADPRNREEMTAALADAGHRVFPSDHVLDPSDVLQLRPDLVILDIGAEVQGVGWHYVRKMRSAPCSSRMPILVCTESYPTSEQLEGTDGPGVLAILRRPFEQKYFLDAVGCASMNQLREGPSPGVTGSGSLIPYAFRHQPDSAGRESVSRSKRG